MKKLSKSFVTMSLVLGALTTMIHPALSQTAAATNSVQFSSGSGYLQGAYKANSQHPGGVNWNRVSSFAAGDNPNVRWSYTVGSEVNEEQIHSLPAIDEDGTVYYVGSAAKKLVAVNSDGAKKWEVNLDGTPIGAPVIAKDGTIYVTSYDENKVYAFTADGKRKWDHSFTAAIKGSVGIGEGGVIYVAGENRNVTALSAVDGEELWYTPVDGKVQGTPIVAEDGTIYIGTLNGALYALNPDGSIQWIKLIPGAISFSSPTIGQDGTIYFGHTKYRVSAVSRTGGLKWEVGTGANIEYSSPAVTNNTVYIVGGTWLRAFDLNGNVKWKVTDPQIDLHNGVIVDANGIIYGTSMEGQLVAYEPKDGSLKWQVGLSRYKLSAPVLGVDGTIYVIDETGRLFAVSTHDEDQGDEKHGIFDLGADTTKHTVSLSWKNEGNPDYVKVSVIRYNEPDATFQTKGTSYVFDGLREHTVYTFEVVPYKDGVPGKAAYITTSTLDPDELTATTEIIYADFVDESNRELLVKVQSQATVNYVVVKDKEQSFKVVQRVPVVDGEAVVRFDKEGTYDISAEAISDTTGNSLYSQSFWLTVEFKDSYVTSSKTSTHAATDPHSSTNRVVSVSEEVGPFYVLTASLPAPNHGERIIYRFQNTSGSVLGSVSGTVTNGESVGKLVKDKKFVPSGTYTVTARYMKGTKTINEISYPFEIVSSNTANADIKIEETGKNYEITASVPSVSGEKVSFRFYKPDGKILGVVNGKTVDGNVIGVLKKRADSLPSGSYKVMVVYSVNLKTVRVVETEFNL